MTAIPTLAIHAAAALAEIVGCCAVWVWRRLQQHAEIVFSQRDVLLLEINPEQIVRHESGQILPVSSVFATIR